MKKHLSLQMIAALILVSTSPRISLAASELARVNDTVITVEEFNKKFAENQKFFQMKAPSKKNVLEDLIKRELGVQEAKKMGIDRDPEIQDRINTVLYHSLLEKKLSKEVEAINITDDYAKTFYAKNPEIRTSHIFVAVRPDARPDQVKKAQEKITRLNTDYIKSGAKDKMSFSEVAQRFSEGVAAPMGGDIDYQTRDKLDPVYYETALALKNPGNISGVVRSQFGFHIIKLTAVRPWEEVDKAQTKRLCFEEKRSQIFEKYMSTLRSQAKVSIKNDLIKE